MRVLPSQIERTVKPIPSPLAASPALVGSVIIACFLCAGCGGNDANSNANGELNSSSEATSKTDRSIDQALHDAVTKKNWSAAKRIGAGALIAEPNDPELLTIVAIANGQLGNETVAADLLVRAARVTGYDVNSQRVQFAVQALVDQGRLYDAITLLEDVIEIHPQAHKYRRMLVGFLGEAQLTNQIPTHMHFLIHARQFDLMLLMATTETSFRRFSSNTIATLLERNPSDLRPLLGRAHTSLESRDVGSAENLLRRILAKHPEFAPAHALLGKALVVQGKTEQLPSWLQEAPQGTSNHAGYWIALGDWALEQGQTVAAIRGFAEATRRNPNESFAWARLANAIAEQQRAIESADRSVRESQHKLSDIAAGIANRRERLLELRQRFSSFVDGNQNSQTAATEIALTLADLGRLWEAEAWLAIATTLPEQSFANLDEERRGIVENLSIDSDWQHTDRHPELNFDLLDYPVPKIDSVEMIAHGDSAQSADRTISQTPIQLTNQAAQWGLNFYGVVGDGVQGPRVPIHQTLGCGGGIIDFDRDGRPDIAFTAAGGSIAKSDNQPGELFRHLGDSFHAIGSDARLDDRNFSHGVCVGDYNDDGFADVLILNLGPNRLFRNNGDGSFSDASSLLNETRADQWSTSGAIVDLDQDGWNDIVVVNYCDSKEPLNEPCFDSQGNEINCYPLRFQAAFDHCLQGSREGQFRDVTSHRMRPAAPGRGLGIVAGRLDGKHIGAYIANDASVNHYYRWNDEQEGALVELGISSGLAVDAQSLDQGSMGIASWDADHDGDLDFYVTGFAGEYNILYEQKASGLWGDVTAKNGLVEPTLRNVAFGTEAIDLDNDGFEELMVANGHIGDFGPESPPYAQDFQIMRQSKVGTWRVTDPSSLGEYFRTPHIGRALMSADVNMDGRMDCVVTHATEPAALLINQTQSSNHSITFELVDTVNTRDSVGAMIEFEVPNASNRGKETRTLFRLAGDGYLCSNQAKLIAGIGSATQIDHVVVTWPDGDRQVIGALESNIGYLIIRDQPAFQLDQLSPRSTP